MLATEPWGGIILHLWRAEYPQTLWGWRVFPLYPQPFRRRHCNHYYYTAQKVIAKLPISLWYPSTLWLQIYLLMRCQDLSPTVFLFSRGVSHQPSLIYLCHIAPPFWPSCCRRVTSHSVFPYLSIQRALVQLASCRWGLEISQYYNYLQTVLITYLYIYFKHLFHFFWKKWLLWKVNCIVSYPNKVPPPPPPSEALPSNLQVFLSPVLGMCNWKFNT